MTADNRQSADTDHVEMYRFDKEAFRVVERDGAYFLVERYPGASDDAE